MQTISPKKCTFAPVMTHFILADNQGLTRIGLQSLCEGLGECRVDIVTGKKELLPLLRMDEDAIIVLDYTLFDFVDISELFILHQRFPEAMWVLLSDELSSDFVRRVTLESQVFSIVTKNGEVADIDKAIRMAVRHKRFICQSVTEQILAYTYRKDPKEDNRLSATEIDILKEIALGKTTKEIASERHSSFHTVNTHRKNIFRKLKVNTAYEAIRYAIRAGLVDYTDYSI
jgi:DNA-binding NarL/FixJ family response regulator